MNKLTEFKLELLHKLYLFIYNLPVDVLYFGANVGGGGCLPPVAQHIPKTTGWPQHLLAIEEHKAPWPSARFEGEPTWKKL